MEMWRSLENRALLQCHFLPTNSRKETECVFVCVGVIFFKYFTRPRDWCGRRRGDTGECGACESGDLWNNFERYGRGCR